MDTGRRRAQIHKTRLSAFQRFSALIRELPGRQIARYSAPMLSPPTKLRSTKRTVPPSAFRESQNIWSIQIAGAKQPSNGAFKNNFCSFPLSSQNATVLSVAAAWTKNEINANSVVSSTKEYSLDQRSGHFLRQSAPPTYARSCRNNG